MQWKEIVKAQRVSVVLKVKPLLTYVSIFQIFIFITEVLYYLLKVQVVHEGIYFRAAVWLTLVFVLRSLDLFPVDASSLLQTFLCFPRATVERDLCLFSIL